MPIIGRLVQFRAYLGFRRDHIGSHIVEFYNVTTGEREPPVVFALRRTAMRRWDRLVDNYIEEYRARGVGTATMENTAARLDRWGRWLKQRRPRVSIERIDAELITRYIDNCSSFRAKATVYGTLSTMRGFGDYLVRQGLWTVSRPTAGPFRELPDRNERSGTV